MKRKIFSMMLVAGMVAFGSCVGDDIDNLQEQINDLNDQVTQLEDAQQAALENQVATLMAQIEALQAANNLQDEEYTAEITALLAQLSALENTVAENKAAVYYGNVISDGEYTAFVESGASIVTGRVEVRSQADVDALTKLETVGGSLTITNGTNIVLPALESVIGSIVIEGVSETDAVIDLPILTVVGSNYSIFSNSGLTSVKTAALNFIAGDFTVDAVLEGYKASLISELELGNSDVKGSVYVAYLNGGDIELGQVGGSFIMKNNVVSNLDVKTTRLNGDFSIEYTGADFTTINFENLVTIGGNFSFSNNDWDPTGMGAEGGITSMNNVFTALTTISGNVNISNNKSLTTFNELNTVTTIGGSSVELSITSPVVEVLTKVQTIGGPYDFPTIKGNFNGELVVAFNELTTPQPKKATVELKLGVYRAASGGIGPVLKALGEKTVVFNGFDKMTSVRKLDIDLTSVSDNSYSNSDGGKATVNAFTELAEIGSDLLIDFSAKDSDITFTGLNKLTTIGYAWNSATLKFNVDASSIKATINAFENMPSFTGHLNVEHVAIVSETGISELNFTNGIPEVLAGKKFTYKCNNLYLPTYIPRNVCVGELNSLLVSSFVTGGTAWTPVLVDRFGTVHTDDPAVADDSFDTMIGYILSCN